MFNIHSPLWFDSACKLSVFLTLLARQVLTSLQTKTTVILTADEAHSIDNTQLRPAQLMASGPYHTISNFYAPLVTCTQEINQHHWSGVMKTTANGLRMGEDG